MNKQDKIKKVMREFKDGKLKTPDGEVVTDKKQALAIAMSESEDYAEKADLIEDISIGSLSDAEDVIKGIGSEELLEKAVYADTAENRKLGRVGQEYHRGKGTKKEDKKTNKNSWGYEIKPEYSNHMSKLISQKFGKYLDGEDESMEFIDSYWKSVANGADERALQNSLKHAIHDRVSPGSKDANDAFKEAMANIKHYEKESQKHYKIKSNTEVRKAIDEIGISDAYRELFGEDLYKAHQDGDMHPNGKWVWVSSASGGKGDWRTFNGRSHKKHQETNGKKGNEQSQTKTIADHASETKTETLQKVVNSNASTQLKQAAKKELKKREDSRKKSIKGKKKQSSTTQNAHVQKLIDFYKISSSRYTDTSKMSIVITPKGNWNLRYDGKDVSTISGHIMDRKTLENAGIKFEDSKKRPVGAGTNGPTPKTKTDTTEKKEQKKLRPVGTGTNGPERRREPSNTQKKDKQPKYSEMSVDSLRKELIGKLLSKKIYRNGVSSGEYSDGNKITGIQKRRDNIYVEYTDGAITRDINITFLDKDDRFKILEPKSDKNKHKVQSNGLTKHDEELIDLAHSTTYRSTIRKYINEAKTDKAKKMLKNILTNSETEWED